MNVPWSDREWSRVVVYGLGVSGLAAARLLRSQAVEVLGVDRRPREELELEELALDPGVELRVGTEPEVLPEGIDGVVVSPGVPPERPLAVAARAAGLPVIAEVELAFSFLRGPLVAITGSNGKSTTTALTGTLLREAGHTVEVCGNIGLPLSACIGPEQDRVYVTELSSFQLQGIVTLRPRAAAWLNLSADHLDRHSDLKGYAAAKRAIFRNQTEEDVAILNADDPLVRETVVRGRRRFFSRLREVEDGCFLQGDRVVEVAQGEPPRTLFTRSRLGLPGEHNLENAMAAALLARALGAPTEAVGSGLAGFRGLPHRMQKVAEIGGVAWFDDSKGTNVDATMRSLEGFADGSVHLILGGRSKGADFSALAPAVTRKARHVYLIGEAAAELHQALRAWAAIERAGDMEQAVALAAGRAAAGEVVLLSPACASFDQYSDFAARGDHFRRLVLALEGAVDG